MSEKPAKKKEVRWFVVLWCIHLHIVGLYCIWIALTSAKWMTVFFTLFIIKLGYLGVTAGAHRLWAHRTFEASALLRLLLVLAHTLAGAGPIYDWVLYHRLHHKYYGTDKDPYNHNKGFLYSHYLANFWTPKVDYEQAQKEVDMSDVDEDIFVWMQKKFYWLFFIIFGLLLPLNAPLEYWDESLTTTLLVTGILRFSITLNMSWLVNSALHIWGLEGSKIKGDSLVIFIVTKTNWPMYHYRVPWDWKYNEFGAYNSGLASFFIKLWHEMRLVDNMQTITTENVRKMLHDVTAKTITMEEAMAQLREVSRLAAAEERLKFNL